MGGRSNAGARTWHSLAALAALAGTAVSWWQLNRAAALVPRLDATAPLPPRCGPLRVAVVIPARDEADHLAPCLASLVAQKLAPTAIWVVDDHSTDATPLMLHRLARELPTLHVLAAPERPPGWVGKTWALHVGVTAALADGTADWLLLTDADTGHHPELLWRALALVDEMGVDLLTAMPAVSDEGQGATLVRAAIGEGLSFLYGADYPARTRDPQRSEAMAAGQFILLRAGAAQGGLDRVGVRDALDDDRALVMDVKAAGHRVAFAYAQALLTTVGYPTAKAAWQGHAHHLTASLGERTGLWRALGAVLATGATLSLPFIALAVAIWQVRRQGWRAALPALLHWGSHAAAVSLLRARAARMANLPGWYVLAAPPAALVVQGLLVRLIVRHRLGRNAIVWKGRRYD
ncbi:MAG: glycosyltransferase [Ktedonobacterales bacterium]|nr:glycosyltransferase [Ktedonobacterales bacterium]